MIHIAIASGVFDTTTVDDAISKALPALSFEDQPRTVIWGYSRGGDPAVQTAHALQDRGFDVDRLYLIDPTDYALKALGTEYVIPKNVAGGGVYWQDSPWYNPLPSGAGVARSLRLEDPVATDWQSREFQGGPFWGHGILPRDSNPLLREDIGRALDDWFGLRPVPPVFQFEDQYGR